MRIDEATAECERWLAYLGRERDKTKALQLLAADARAGRKTRQEIDREMKQINGLSPTVYDAAELERAVSTLLKQVKRERQNAD